MEEIRPLPVIQCDSISPEGEQCSKKRGHKQNRHQVKRADGWDQNHWQSGRSGNKAYRRQPDGDMSEGEWQAFGRFGY